MPTLVRSPPESVAIALSSGTPGKPVGLVCFGFAMRAGDGITTLAATHTFSGDRAEVRHAAVDFALRGVLGMLGIQTVVAGAGTAAEPYAEVSAPR